MELNNIVLGLDTHGAQTDEAFSEWKTIPPPSPFRLQKTIEDILDGNWETCDGPIDCQVNYTVKVQKSMKSIARILLLPSVVQS